MNSLQLKFKASTVTIINMWLLFLARFIKFNIHIIYHVELESRENHTEIRKSISFCKFHNNNKSSLRINQICSKWVFFKQVQLPWTADGWSEASMGSLLPVECLWRRKRSSHQHCCCCASVLFGQTTTTVDGRRAVCSPVKVLQLLWSLQRSIHRAVFPRWSLKWSCEQFHLYWDRLHTPSLWRGVRTRSWTQLTNCSTG